VVSIHGQGRWKVKSERVTTRGIGVQFVQIAAEFLSLANASVPSLDKDFNHQGLLPIVAIRDPARNTEPADFVDVSYIIHMSVP
jgi:hypothetical protein